MNKAPRKKAQTEILHVNTKKVSCDGSKEGQDPTSGHPLVYLNMGEKDSVTCPYCGKIFQLKKAK